MFKKIACPNSDDLKSFLQGELDEADLGSIAEHLEQCPPCQAMMNTISPHDTLLENAQGDFSRAERLVADMPRPLLEILKRLPQHAGWDEGVTHGFGGTAEATSDADFLSPPQKPDEIGRLGSYRVLGILGKGGMGMVFLAHDPNLDRKVALKVMLPKYAANEGAKQRFLREARAAAKLNSDNIVDIYQVGEDRGVPFFAMELLQGAGLDQFLQEGRQLTLPQILRIGREIANGLAAAHEKDLIHRDIKPSNVWIDETNSNRVKILDFGLARSEKDDIHLTHDGAIVGTPAYMAPEQARGDKDVDARADLFSLGCVLYRLCSGDNPFKAETTMGVLLAIAVNDPVPLTQINVRIPPSLSELILQMLLKDPAKRPASAREVIARLQEIEKESAGEHEYLAPTSRDDTYPRNARNPAPWVATGIEAAIAETETAAAKPPRNNGWFVLVGGLGVAFPFLLAAAVFFWQTPVGVVRIESDDPAIQIGFDQGEIKIAGAYKEPLMLAAGTHGVKIKKGDDFEFETDKLIVSRGEKIVLQIEVLAGEVRIVQEGKGVLDTKQFAKAGASTAGKTKPVDVKPMDTKPVDSTPVDAKASNPEFLYALPWIDEQQSVQSHLYQTEISSDGRLFIALGDTGPTGYIRVCETANGKQVQLLIPGGEPWFNFAKFLPGSQFLVASYNLKKDLYLYEVATGQIVRKFIGHTEPNPQFAVSPDGNLILSWSNDKTLRLWDVGTGTEIRKFEGHADKAAGVFSPDGTQILTFSPDKTLRLWSVETGEELKKLEGHTGSPIGCFSPDGKQALSYGPDATIRLWDLATGNHIRRYEGPTDEVRTAGFAADGRLVVAGSHIRKDGHFRIWEAKSGKLLREIDCAPFGGDGWSFTATPDGRQGVVNHQDGSIRVIDLVTGKETHRFNNCRKARAFSFSPDGTLVVAGSFRAGVFVFRLGSPPRDGGWTFSAN